MDISVFSNRKEIPTENNLQELIGDSFGLWEKIRYYVHMKYPGAVDQWVNPGEKYGWHLRIKDKKRTIVYLLPTENYFKVALVYGQKATDVVMQSHVSDPIKSQLASAKVYAEGRGIKIDVTGKDILNDVEVLIDIKIAY
ncbi:MAG: DUF3788 family protein [Candidatus Saccharibacteria bacterium]